MPTMMIRMIMTTKIGVNTLPTRSRSFDGVMDSHQPQAKYRAVKMARGIMPSPVMGRMPMEKDVAAVLGMAIKGPMAKYINVKIIRENKGEILRFISARKPPGLKVPMMTATTGMPMPDKRKPRMAGVKA